MKTITLLAIPALLTPSLFAQTQQPAAPKDAMGNRASAAFTPRQFQATTGVSSFVPAWAPFGPKGANAKAVAASPTAPNVRITGVTDSFGSGGLYRSGDNGGYWMQASETGARGINDVEFTASGIAFAATQDGLFRSTDDGNTWSQVTLPGGQAATLVQSLAADPTNGQVIWVGLGQFLNGTSTELVLRSLDGGDTWSDLSPPAASGMGVTALAVDPANSQHIAAAFSGNFGFGNDLWVSNDGGQNWEERSAGLPNNILWDIAFAPGKLYVSGGQDFGGQFVGLYSSPDNGVSWSELSATWPSRSVTSVAVNPSNPQQVYAGTQRAGLGVSNDGGATWTFSIGGTGSLPVNDISFVPGQASTIFLAMNSIAVLRSTNSGGSFQPAAFGINRMSISAIAVNPQNSSEIVISYVGDNDGGIFKSTDAGETWVFDEQAPLPRWQFLTFAPDGKLYATHDGPLGRADDGVWQRQADGTWIDLGPGTPDFFDMEGRAIAVSSDPTHEILFGGTEGYYGGQDAAMWSFNRAGNATWEKNYESNPVQSERFSAIQWLGGGAGPEAVASMVNFGFENGGAGGIFRTTDSGQTWARSESGYPFGWHAWTLSSRPSEPNTLYTSSSQSTFSSINNRIFKSTDGGLTWVDQGNGIDTPPFRQMIVDPAAPGVIYGADLFSNNVYRSTDDGATFQIFSDGLIGQGGGAAFAYGGTFRKLYYGTSAGAFATALEPVTPACAADLGSVGGVPGQDGQLNNNDFIAFINYFFNNDSHADLGTTGGLPGSDGQYNNNDFIAFINLFFAGC
ncbi:MAG: GC-type dockerin domain-anchored protein [Phycisphaerales bacterium]